MVVYSSYVRPDNRMLGEPNVEDVAPKTSNDATGVIVPMPT